MSSLNFPGLKSRRRKQFTEIYSWNTKKYIRIKLIAPLHVILKFTIQIWDDIGCTWIFKSKRVWQRPFWPFSLKSPRFHVQRHEKGKSYHSSFGMGNYLNTNILTNKENQMCNFWTPTNWIISFLHLWEIALHLIIYV